MYMISLQDVENVFAFIIMIFTTRSIIHTESKLLLNSYRQKKGKHVMAYLTLTKSKLIHLATLCEANELLLKELDEKLEGDVVFTNYDVIYTSSIEEGYIKLFTDDDYIKLQIN